jgi:hypothetical protein
MYISHLMYVVTYGLNLVVDNSILFLNNLVVNVWPESGLAFVVSRFLHVS